MKKITNIMIALLAITFTQNMSAQVSPLTVMEAGYCKITKQGPVFDIQYAIENSGNDTLHVTLLSSTLPVHFSVSPNSTKKIAPLDDNRLTIELLPGNNVIVRDLKDGIVIEEVGKVKVTDIVPDDCPGCRH
jgi:hypothetical protein